MTFEDFDEDYQPKQSKAKDKASKPPKPYDHMTWEQYKVRMLREHMMAYLQCEPWQYVEFIREKQDELARLLPDEAKESMRRVIQHSLEESRGAISIEDTNMINRVFGPYKRAEPPPISYSSDYHEDPFYGGCKSRRPEEVIKWFRHCTFRAFHVFMHMEPDITGFIASLTDEQTELLREAVEYQCVTDAGPMTKAFRHYQEGDREDMMGIIDRARGLDQ